MSADFQTAQAIHESGWGQYIPVDKYSGEFSNNLFGIKGSGRSSTTGHLEPLLSEEQAMQ